MRFLELNNFFVMALYSGIRTKKYIADRHFALSHNAWDANKAKVVIQGTATDVIKNLKSGYLWPSHPLGGDASGHGMYFGTSGVMARSKSS